MNFSCHWTFAKRTSLLFLGNIIESLDKLQQDLKLEEDLEKQLDNSSGTGEVSRNTFVNVYRFVSSRLVSQPTTYDTAHFLQWAKEKFREELAGRLTAQVIDESHVFNSFFFILIDLHGSTRFFSLLFEKNFVRSTFVFSSRL